MKRISSLLIALTVLFLGLPKAGEAQVAALPEIEIIFDASGSMTDPTADGVLKIDAAKEALKQITSEIEAGSKVGLRVFGAQPTDDNPELSCRDSQLIIPIGGINKQQMLNQVNGLLAQGQTPIGFSLQEAANDFTPGANVKKTIILISDGEESCGLDPIVVVQGLKAKGINVVIHTIGFNVNAKARAQLQQIAKMTGGIYANATSAGELTKQLKKIAVKAELLLKPKKQEGENILAAITGTRIVSSSTPEFAKLIDGNLDKNTEAMYEGQEAVFEFKGAQPVLIEGFGYPVKTQSNYHPGFIDLYGSIEGPDKGFRFIGRAKVENKVYFDNVWQVTKLETPAPVKWLKAITSSRINGGGSNTYQPEWAAYGKFLSEGEFQAELAKEAGRDKNLLATENGGKLIASSEPKMAFLIDGNPMYIGKEAGISFNSEAIFGFKNGKTALIKKITTPIFKTYKRNPKTIEVWASSSSPTSGYEKIGTLETMNLAFAENAYQELAFTQPVRAKFLKVKFVDAHGGSYIIAHELQAIGTLE